MSLFLSGNHSRFKKPCPPWACFAIDNVFRKALHNPFKLLGPYIKKGDTIIDIGPGKGYFTIPLAKMAGSNGMVHAFDIQPEMLEGIEKRAQKYHLKQIIQCHLVKPDNTYFSVKAQFALAFWMLHEVPDVKKTASQIHKMLVPGGLFLVAEPLVHVSQRKYLKNESIIKHSGFSVVNRPQVALSRATLFKKQTLLGSLRERVSDLAL